MEATDILKREHRAIESVLDSLDRAATAVEQGKQVQPAIFEDGLDFIRNFADRCHHGKEEGRLFPIFESHGLPVEGGPIGVMLAEHEQGRSHVRQAASQLAQWRNGDAAAGLPMANAIRSYTQLLRQHIFKEDNILYPMGDNMISAEDDRRLVAEFEEVEEKEIGPGVHERYHAMIERLEEETSRL